MSLSDIEELRLGGDDSVEMKIAVIAAAVLAVGLTVLLFIGYATSQAGF